LPYLQQSKGYQPVVWNDLSKEALRFYLDKVRPKLERQSQYLLEENSPLFPSLRVTNAPVDCSRALKNFLARTGIISTSTNLRALVSTESLQATNISYIYLIFSIHNLLFF